MKNFSARELENADLAYKMHILLHPDGPTLYRFFEELSDHFPDPLLSALLDAHFLRFPKWRRARHVPKPWQRSVFMLHQYTLVPGETSLFHMAAWGRFREPQFTKRSKLHMTIIEVFLDLQEVAPHRVLPLLRGRCQESDKKIQEALEILFESGQLTRNPVSGMWRADKRGFHAWHLLREREEREQAAAVVQLPVAV